MEKVNIDDLQGENYYIMIRPNLADERIYIEEISQTNSVRTIYYRIIKANGSKSDKLYKESLETSSPIDFYRETSTHTLLSQPSSSQTTLTASTKGSKKQIVSCTHGVELLHQHTGQCWNDASIILLWFSSGIGPIIQEALQAENLLKDFTNWIKDKTIRDQLVAIFPDILNQDYDYFVKEIIAYLDSLQKRYALWSSLESPKKEKTTSQRRLSCNISEQSQISGQRASESLYFNRNSVEIYGSNSVDPGYNSMKMANIYYILLHFFLKGNIVLDVFHQRDAAGYGASLPQFNRVVLLHNPYIITRDISKQSPIYYQSIFDRFGPNYRFSFVATFQRTRQNKHAVSFLTCSEGNEFFYDNNYYEFVSLNWSRFFTNVDQRMVSLAYVIQPHESANIEGIPIPYQEPLLFILLNLANNGSLSFFTTHGLVHRVDDLRGFSFFQNRPQIVDRSWGDNLLRRLLMSQCKKVYYLLCIDFLLFDPVQPGNQNGSLQKLLVSNTNTTNQYYLQKKLNIKKTVPKGITLNPHISRNMYTSMAYRQRLETFLVEENILKEAIDNHQDNIAAELIRYYLDIYTILNLLLHYVKINNTDVVRLILNNIENRITFIIDYENGGTYMGNALRIAIAKNNIEIIQLLLQKGVDTDSIKQIYTQIDDNNLKELLFSFIDDEVFKKEQSTKKTKKEGGTRKAKGKARKQKSIVWKTRKNNL